MYDLSGLGEGGTQIVIDDWKLLVDKMRIGRDENDGAYLHHNGKPLVAVWDVGFNDGRKIDRSRVSKVREATANARFLDSVTSG